MARGYDFTTINQVLVVAMSQQPTISYDMPNIKYNIAPTKIDLLPSPRLDIMTSYVLVR